MSKKDKSKFHRRLRAEILKQMEKPKISTTQVPTEPAKIASRTFIQPSKPIESTPLSISTPITSTDSSLALVRNDLKKSALIIGSIILSIVVLYFIDFKTDILVRASSGIFKALHLGI